MHYINRKIQYSTARTAVTLPESWIDQTVGFV